MGRRVGGQVLPGSVPAERRRRRRAGGPAQFAVESGEGAERPGVVVGVDGEQLAVLGCVCEHGLPFAEGRLMESSPCGKTVIRMSSYGAVLDR